MIKGCTYAGQMPMNSSMCNSCELFMETCKPIATLEGYALGGECDAFFCPACEVKECAMKQLVNL